MEDLQCAKCFAKHFKCIIGFNSHNPMTLLLSPYPKWENWGLGCHLPTNHIGVHSALELWNLPYQLWSLFS